MKLFFLTLFFTSLSLLSAQNKQEIDSFIAQFVQVWNKHNAKELSNLWVEDGDLINPAGKIAKGKTAIELNLMKEHRSLLRFSSMEQVVDNVRFLNPNLAFVDANVKITIPNFTKEPIEHHIVYLLGKQANGEWKIISSRPYQFLELPLPDDYNVQNSK